jgi:hypothetical protein
LHKGLLLSVFIFLLSISALSQGGNYFSPGGSHGLADNYRWQELIDGHPSQTAIHQRKYLHLFQQLDSL